MDRTGVLQGTMLNGKAIRIPTTHGLTKTIGKFLSTSFQSLPLLLPLGLTSLSFFSLHSNAPELIAQYYAELKEKKPTKGKAPKRGRSSMQVDDDVVMLDGDPKEDRPSKKARKETTTVSGKSTKKKDNSRLSTSSKSTNLMKFSSLNEAADKEEFMAIPNPHDPQVKYDSMQKHWELEDWSPLIDEILTVDYASDSKTTVIYFMRLWVWSYISVECNSKAFSPTGKMAPSQLQQGIICL